MNPSEDVPASMVNGQTSNVNPPPAAALKSKAKPKKGALHFG